MNLNTKAARLAARSAVLDSLRAAGATVAEHPDAGCITVFESTARGATIRIYDGTAARPALYESYRSADRARQILDEQVENRRARIQRRKDEAGKRTLSEEAQTAAVIRKRLRQTFPKVKFSVTCDSFAGGNSVSIYWTDGPVSAIVDHITRQYAWGTFDPYTDCSGSRDLDPSLGCPGAKFVQASRTISPERRAQLEAHAVETFGSIEVFKDQWGEFDHRRYERQHPETWEEAYRELHEQQQAEAAEAQRLAWEEQQTEERKAEQQRRAQRDLLHQVAKLAALECAEAHPGTLDLIRREGASVAVQLHGEMLVQEAARLALELYGPILAAMGAPRHFSPMERAAYMAIVPDELEAMDAPEPGESLPVSLESLAGILAAREENKVVNIADFRR